jgi:DNA-entry nuclease
MYRVTPIFEGDNLLCDGVQIEALSVEDSGSGICFNVFCYNVQPGIIIDYADGSNRLEDGYTATIPRQQPSEQSAYIGNRNSHVFHYSYCESVSDMKEKNKIYFSDMPRDEIIDSGFKPCQRCNP